MARIFTVVVFLLQACILGASAAQARTITLSYDISTTFADAFARNLYYMDPENPDPYARPLSCSRGRDCYPEDWRPDLSWNRKWDHAFGETRSTTIDMVLLETETGYEVSSFTYAGALNLRALSGYYRVRSFDTATSDILFSFMSNHSAGWDVTLGGGTGLFRFSTEFGSVDGSVSGCSLNSEAYIASLGLPEPFCDAYDAEAHFAVESYTVDSVIVAPVPPSALFLMSAVGGLVLRKRLRGSAA